jgi:hypothetical protein
MTKDKLKQLVDAGIIDAIINDKPMQYRLEGGAWFDFEGMPDFDTDNVEYRVRPKLKVPVTARWGDLTDFTKDSRSVWVVLVDNQQPKLVVGFYAGTCGMSVVWDIRDNDTVIIQ